MLLEMRAQIAELNSQLRVDVDPDDLPLIELPAAVITPGQPMGLLCSSEWDFADHCRALINSKQYRGGAG